MEQRTLRTLIVDDNVPYAECLKEMLAEGGETTFSVEQAGSLAQGLERLAKESFDVVLLDLKLPDGEGPSVCEAVHAASPSAAIVIVSGSLDERGNAAKCLQKGAQDYLVKEDFERKYLLHSMLYAVQRKKVENDYRDAQNALVEANRALVEKVIELDRLNAIMMGREERIIEMKEEIKTLKEKRL